MPTVYDSSGKSYILSEQIGRGGEGTVFACPNDFNLVAKIYHEEIEPEKAEKLRWMADNKNERLLKVAAWIVDTLTDAPDGKIVGFLMPNVKAKEIHELYSLKSRRVYFPNATWQFLVHTSTNLARAFYSLHKDGHIMGDVNHGNCVVLADGTVKLIDCDSYSIKKDDSRYVCEVGVGTHLAPELQGKNLRDIERLEKHDNFGLAVIIFQLLFLGRHPFAGIYLGDEDKSIEDCIREIRFAYGADAQDRQVKQPPGTLSLAQISPRLALMFERAFLTEDRPEPQEWIEALDDLTQKLKQCAVHPGHHYFQTLTDCPWCGIEAQTGLMLFPFVSAKTASGEEAFNIFTVENLIASLNVPTNLPMLPPKQVIPVAPSTKAQSVRKDIRDRLILLTTAQLILTGIFVMAFGGCAVLIPSIIIFAIFYKSFSNYNNSRKLDLELELDSARQKWHGLESDWGILRSDTQFADNIVEIRKKLDDYQNLHKETRNRVKYVQDRIYRRRLNEYLSSFEIADSKIFGLGEKKQNVLRAFGVKTAADVEKTRLNLIESTGDLTVQRLIEWRKHLERNFKYVPDSEIEKAEREEAEREVSSTRRNMERDINNLLVPIRSMAVKIRQQHHQLTSKSSELAEKLSQSKSDFESIALKIPAALAMGSIALVMTFFGNIIHSSSQLAGNNSRSKTIYGTSAPAPPAVKTVSGIGSGGGSGSGSGIGSGSPVYSDNYKVAENLTDEQIEAMTDWERKSAAKTLDKEAMTLAYTNKDFKKAEKKLRLAVRLDDSNSGMLNQFAVMLYEQKRYSDSLEISEKSLKASPGNVPTRIMIGKNHLMLEDFEKAKDTFNDVSYESPTAEVFYSIGLAHKGLQENYSAVNSFKKAVELDSAHTEAHFELGAMLIQVGNIKEAREQYDILLDLDFNTAKKLKPIIDGK